MFRRVIVLLLALFMLGGAACAESTDALYLLQSGEKALGTAVLYQDQHTLLTSLWALLGAEDDLCAVGAGGTLTVRESTLLADGLVQLTLEEASPAVPLQVSRGARMVYALGHNAEHQPVHKVAGYCSHFPYDETERHVGRSLHCSPQKYRPGLSSGAVSTLATETSSLFFLFLVDNPPIYRIFW
jgi:hypothetical protein